MRISLRAPFWHKRLAQHWGRALVQRFERETDEKHAENKKAPGAGAFYSPENQFA